MDLVAPFGGRVPADVARTTFFACLRAVAGCHQRRVAHRNIQLSNFLVHPGTGQVCLSTFCCARRFAVGEAAEEAVGSTALRPPECAGPAAARCYDPFKWDTWQLGLLFVSLMAQVSPVGLARSEATHDKLMANDLEGFWREFAAVHARYYRGPLPLEAADKAFAELMLRANPAERPLPVDLCRHAWCSSPAAPKATPQRLVDMTRYAARRMQQQRRRDDQAALDELLAVLRRGRAVATTSGVLEATAPAAAAKGGAVVAAKP